MEAPARRRRAPALAPALGPALGPVDVEAAAALLRRLTVRPIRRRLWRR